MIYGDTLESIERNYGCVAEYYRCKEEQEYDQYNPIAHNLDDIEIPYENEIRKFEIGKEYTFYDIFDGGITYFTIKEIHRENNKILCSQKWEGLDGTGTRPDEEFIISLDENGNERFLVFSSEKYGEFYIYA